MFGSEYTLLTGELLDTGLLLRPFCLLDFHAAMLEGLLRFGKLLLFKGLAMVVGGLLFKVF